MAITFNSAQSSVLSIPSPVPSHFNNTPTAWLGYCFCFLTPSECMQSEVQLVNKCWLTTSRSIAVLQNQLKVCDRQKNHFEILDELVLFISAENALSPKECRKFFKNDKFESLKTRLAYLIGQKWLIQASYTDCLEEGERQLRFDEWGIIQRGFVKASIRQCRREWRREVKSQPSLPFIISLEKRLLSYLKIAKENIKIDWVQKLPLTLSEEVFSFLTPREFAAPRCVSRNWLLSGKSTLLWEKQMNTYIKTNRLKSLNATLTFLSNRINSTNLIAVRRFFQGKNLKPLEMRFQYLLGKNALGKGLSDQEYLEEGKKFLALKSWTLWNCALIGMTLDEYVPELQQEINAQSSS